MQLTRRDFVKLAGTAALVGSTGLAGCISNGNLGGVDADADAPRVEVEPNYRGWFDGVSNYRGTLDLRGREEVRVRVGAKGSLGHFKFDPPAIAVSPGTTVVWEWTGKGGAHDVVAENGSFDSGALTSRAGATFEHAFESPAIYKYYCTPHRGMGMKGAVFVAL